MEELLPRLEWMEGLESLSILLGSDSQSHVEDGFLQAFCIVGLPIDPLVVEKHFIQNINPDRPAFWFYVGSELPEAKDHTIPRIHYEGNVNPNNPYGAPPGF